MNVFETNFAQLNKEKKLVLVKHCGSQWQREFLQNLAEGRQVVDLGQGTEPGPLGNALYYIAAESL